MCNVVFSSRRRHTRWPRDWSSDVCSSDLRRYVKHEGGFGSGTWSVSPRQEGAPEPGRLPPDGGSRLRSEERRVGKECRIGWALEQQKKKTSRHRRNKRCRCHKEESSITRM